MGSGQARGWAWGAVVAIAAGMTPGCGLLRVMDHDFTAPGAPAPAPGQQAKSSVNRAGPEAKYVDVAGFSGFLYGARAVRHLAPWPAAYGGFMAYGTLPVIGDELGPSFCYLGGLAGWEFRPTTWLYLDTGLLVGFTTDVFKGTPNPLGRQLTLEPSVALGVPMPWPVPAGWRLSVVGGCLMLPMAGEFTGWTFGLRAEQKSLEQKVVTWD